MGKRTRIKNIAMYFKKKKQHPKEIVATSYLVLSTFWFKESLCVFASQGLPLQAAEARTEGVKPVFVVGRDGEVVCGGRSVWDHHVLNCELKSLSRDCSVLH